jgi:hypothetical protein
LFPFVVALSGWASSWSLPRGLFPQRNTFPASPFIALFAICRRDGDRATLAGSPAILTFLVACPIAAMALIVQQTGILIDAAASTMATVNRASSATSHTCVFCHISTFQHRLTALPQFPCRVASNPWCVKIPTHRSRVNVPVARSIAVYLGTPGRVMIEREG